MKTSTSEHDTPNIVAFAGGTGGSVLAPGLVEAIPHAHVTIGVAMADSGSRTGDLRHIFGGPAVGDLRNVLAAVSGNEAGRLFKVRFGYEATLDDIKTTNQRFLGAISLKQDMSSRAENVMDQVLAVAQATQGYQEYRLQGHTYGNLVLTALRLEYGDDILTATEQASRWLDAKARVLPATPESHNLVLHDAAHQTIVYGEDEIDRYDLINPESAYIWLETGEVCNFIEDDPRRVQQLLEAADHAARPKAAPELVQATAASDIALVGPGSPITSLRPALQPKGLARGLQRQHHRGGLWVAVTNNDPEAASPTLSVERYLEWLQRDSGRNFTHVIHNDPTAELPQNISLREPGLKIGDAIAIGAALIAVQNAEYDVHDPLRDWRAQRLTDSHAVGSVIAALAGSRG